MIKSLIVPLIFGTLVVGIAGHGDDMKKVGRLAFRSILYFEVVTTLALAIGLLVVNVVKPGAGVNGLGVLVSLGKLVGTLYGALALFILLVLFPVALVARIPIARFWKYVKEPWLIAFSTASSDAALPLAMENLEEMGLP